MEAEGKKKHISLNASLVLYLNKAIIYFLKNASLSCLQAYTMDVEE